MQQVIIGLDNIEMLEEMDISEPSDFDFSMEEITSEDSDIDDDSDEVKNVIFVMPFLTYYLLVMDVLTLSYFLFALVQDVFTILEDDEDDLISSEISNDWTNLETMQSSHPMYFARKIAEVYCFSKCFLLFDNKTTFSLTG